MKRFLITTADERSWKFDQPVLFLGEWCRRYDRKHVWQNMDAIVTEPYGIKLEEKKANIKYVQQLARELLFELSDTLNKFHNTNHSTRYWEIVLGHWLQRYVAVIFNRYFTLETALKNYEVSSTVVFDDSNYSLATNDSLSFIWACNNDVWNHILYFKILNFIGGIDLEIKPLTHSDTSFSPEPKIKAGQKINWKQSLITVSNKILNVFSRKTDAFIINSYLPRREEIKLQISLGQFPQLWQSPNLENMPLDHHQRKHFHIDSKTKTGFEKFVRLQISEILPTCYLEGHQHLINQANLQPWPTKPKFIFTSNNFDTDEIFKTWTASKVEIGTPYFTGQHGNNYGTHIYYGNSNSSEQTTSDKFLTWGWSGKSNLLPAFNFKIANQKTEIFNPKGGLLLIEVSQPHFINPWDSYFEFGIYQEEQFRFAESLPENIQNKLTVRLHAEYKKHRWAETERWKDRNPQIKLETGEARIQSLIAQSRLVVHSYDSTGILETLALNIPTLCFWNGGLDHLVESAKPYYELLRNCGILQDSPKQAAEFITRHWNNLTTWWNSEEVQKARKNFCARHSRTEKYPVRTLKKILTQGK